MEIIEIRKAGFEDAERISEIILHAFIEFRAFYTDEAFAATTVSSEEVVERMKEGIVWVALLNDNIIGTAAVVKRDEELFIRGMAVLPEARGLNTGPSLLQHIEDYAVENNFRILSLTTTPYLGSAIHLYEKFGFRKFGETDNSFYGTLIFTMKKYL